METKNLRTKLEEFRDRISTGIGGDAEKAQALIETAILAAQKKKELLMGDPLSFAHALITAGRLDLDASGVLGQGWLIYDKKQVNFLPSWQGLRDVVLRGGSVLDIETRIVYAKDEFEVEYGLHPKLVHRASGEVGEIKAAYMIAHLAGGRDKFEVLWAPEIAAIQNCSQMKATGPWKFFRGEMVRKAVLRRGLKQLSLDPGVQKQLSQALAKEDELYGLTDEAKGETVAKPLQEGRIGFGKKKLVELNPQSSSPEAPAEPAADDIPF